MTIKTKNFIGCILTVFLTVIAVIVLDGAGVLTNIGSNFTSPDGDGLKDFYNTYYHVEYDSSAFHSSSMNYPYGDYYTYTGAMPHVFVPLRIARSLGADNCSQLVLPLNNIFLILSIFICAIALFLIFRELGLNYFISVVGAVLITMLSPQLERIGSHITLGYMFILPLMIYWFIRLIKTNNIAYSIWEGLLLLWSGFVHPYYLIFFGIFNLCFWLYVLIWDKQWFVKRKTVILHVLISFLIPCISFLILNGIGNTPADRAAVPYGLKAYAGRLEGVFFPYGRSYFHKPEFLHNIEWEAISYIGIVSVCITISCLIKFITNIIQKRWSHLFDVTGNRMLNVFLVISIIVLLFSIGVPLLWVKSCHLSYLGPLAQIRALARFEWLFYYMINIVTVYILGRWIVSDGKNKAFRYGTGIIILLIMSFEVYSYNKNFSLVNENPLLTDYDNNLPKNQWVKEYQWSDYQAIIPLPLFHIGTEHIWIDDNANMFKQAAYVSLKTGLPMSGNYASRSPIKCSYNNIALKWSPLEQYALLNDLPNRKPFLVVVPKDDNLLNENEKNIVSHSQLLFDTGNHNYYRLECDDLEKNYQEYKSQQEEKCQTVSVFERGNGVWSDREDGLLIVTDWDNLQSEKKFLGNGALQCDLSRYNKLWDNVIETDKDEIEISFWMSDFTEDMYARSVIEICTKKDDGETRYYEMNDIFRHVVNLYNGWALISVKIPASKGTNHLSVVVGNLKIMPHQVCFDNLIIRDTDVNVLSTDGESTLLNNKWVR